MFVFLNYLVWHYGEALKALLTIQKNYIIGAWHQFLIGQHFKTLFFPWHRRQPSDFGKATNIGDKIIDGVIDFYIRILAAIIRLSIIISGLIWIVIIYFVFWAAFIFWVLWPLIFLGVVIKGLSLIL